MTTEIYKRPFLVFGCGNTLFGNDGFGPEVVDHIKASCTLPDSVLVLDAGTGIRDFIFDLLLMEKKPETVIIIDAVTTEGKARGEVFEIDLADMPGEKMSDFSLHQSPTSNLLSQLAQQGIEVKIIAMNTEFIPNEISPGLCPAAKKAVRVASKQVIADIKSRYAF